MGFAFDTPTNPVGTVTEADIDAYWKKYDDRGDTSNTSHYDDMDQYFRTVVTAGIPSGHNVKWGINDAGTKYYLTISGPNINKTWS